MFSSELNLAIMFLVGTITLLFFLSVDMRFRNKIYNFKAKREIGNDDSLVDMLIESNSNNTSGEGNDDGPGGSIGFRKIEDFQFCDADEYKFKVDLENRYFLVNGQRITDDGIYCIKKNLSTIGCNRYTSIVVEPGVCAPKWPGVFGGIDGNDVLVCGGVLYDRKTNSYYDKRLPNVNLGDIINPYTDTIVTVTSGGETNREPRFTCAPGYYDRLDDQGNKMLKLNNFSLYENYCSRLIYDAIDEIAPSKGQCKCLPSQGDLRGRRAQETAKDDGGFVTTSYQCSPCVATFKIANTLIVNVPRECTKQYARPDEQIYMSETERNLPISSAITKMAPRHIIDLMPCGANSFTRKSVKCLDGNVYLGFRGLSEFSRKIVKRDVASIVGKLIK